MPIQLMFKKAVATMVAAAFSFPALANCDFANPPEGLFTENDAKRFSTLVNSRTEALSIGLRSKSQENRVLLAGHMAQLVPPREGGTPAVGAASLTGSYNCRIIKVGGIGPNITPYKDFRCEIRETADSVTIEKKTGSQRFFGKLVASGDGFAFAGTSHYSDEKPFPYSSGVERDQAGCLSIGAAGVLLLEQPYPYYESVYDLVVMTRRR